MHVQFSDLKVELTLDNWAALPVERLAILFLDLQRQVPAVAFPEEVQRLGDITSLIFRLGAVMHGRERWHRAIEECSAQLSPQSLATLGAASMLEKAARLVLEGEQHES